jgi:hypothetical protein
MAVQRTSREGRTLRWLVVVPIVIAVLDDIAYVALIASQPEHAPDIFTVPFVATFIALMAALLALSLAGSPLVVTLRPALRAGAAAGLVVLGVLGAFSIGLPLLFAGFLATGAAIRTLAGGGLPAVTAEIAAAVLAIALLVVGFEVTARVIVCPTDGSSSGGSWPGIVTHGFSWECSGGRLHSR